VVRNVCSTGNSDPATLHVTLDLIKPFVADAGCDSHPELDPTADRNILVVFSEPVTTASVQVLPPANWVLDGGLSIVSAVLLSDNRTVLLTADGPLIPNQPYTLHVEGVTDRSLTGNVMPDRPSPGRYVSR
jgi:hypothetical protein